MTLAEIKEMPTVHRFDERLKIHESVLRSYNILEYVLEMVGRGDSKQTIKDVANYLQHADS